MPELSRVFNLPVAHSPHGVDPTIGGYVSETAIYELNPALIEKRRDLGFWGLKTLKT